MVANAGNTLKSLGVQQEQINAVVKAIDPGQLVALAGAVLASTLGVLSNLFFLIVLLFFMAFDTDSTRRSVAVLGERMPDLAAALSSFARGARNYMAVAAGFGFIVAVLDGVALAIMGVPGAFVWAVLAFVTNFIPNIGFVIGVIPPALIALLDGGPGLMIAVIVTYSVINFLIQSVIQPRVVGDTVGLTALFTFMSLVFWTWVIGPLGALLAVPLTLLARALLIETNPRLRWALPLIAGKAEPTEQPSRSNPRKKRLKRVRNESKLPPDTPGPRHPRGRRRSPGDSPATAFPSCSLVPTRQSCSQPHRRPLRRTDDHQRSTIRLGEPLIRGGVTASNSIHLRFGIGQSIWSIGRSAAANPGRRRRWRPDAFQARYSVKQIATLVVGAGVEVADQLARLGGATLTAALPQPHSQRRHDQRPLRRRMNVSASRQQTSASMELLQC